MINKTSKKKTSEGNRGRNRGQVKPTPFTTDFIFTKMLCCLQWSD